jgi:hypothetical protein
VFRSATRARRPIALAAGVLLAGLGLAGSAMAEEAPGSAPAAVQKMPLVAGTPCTATARACVDLESQRAWLLDHGGLVRGPVKISSGGNGKETPEGHSLRVYRKDKDHKSQESRLPNGQPAPMPWSVFFEDGGIAFHSGDPARSSGGCIHLAAADAQAWFNFLNVGDQVQVVRASKETAARAGQPAAAPQASTPKDSTPKDSDSDSEDGDEDEASGDDSEEPEPSDPDESDDDSDEGSDEGSGDGG